MVGQPHERRALNEGIESAFIEAAGWAATIMAHFQLGRGALIDAYDEFYYNVAILVELTSELEEMNTETDAIKNITDWLSVETKRGITSDRELHERCQSGLVAFRAYKKALNKQGIFSLPSGRGK